MSNSSLICYTKLSPNCHPRKNSVYNPTGRISKITIHHMAGNCGIEALGDDFARPERNGSSNYGVGTDGRIAMYVPEDHRAWTSSNRMNDYNAVTIEVANNSGKPKWTVSDKALQATIDLVVDICERNDIEKLTYTGKLAGSNLTRHDWFANTTCPGPYLGGKFPYIVEEVNKRLNKEEPVVEDVAKVYYRVRKSWKDVASQIGAYTSLKNAIKCVNSNNGYFVYDNDGTQVYPEIPKVEPIVTLRKGDKGDKVEKLQSNLIKLGYTELGETDGNFGTKTLKSVKEFQKNNGLEVDGIAGPKTQKAIDDLLNYSLKDFVTEIQIILNDTVDGVADPQTLAKTVTISSTKNKRHKVVKPVQKRLMAMGYTEVGKADGNAGSKFTAAVKALQKKQGKTVDGEITKKQYTWKLLLGMVK